MNNKEYTTQSLYSYGLWLLSKREYSVKQIKDKMSNKSDNNTFIQQAIDKLQENNYLSDDRKAQSIIRMYSHKENGHKLIQRLKIAGIEQPVIDNLLEKSDTQEQQEKCFNLLSRKFKYFEEYKKDKYVRFLLSKGFEYSAVKKALEHFKNNQQD